MDSKKKALNAAGVVFFLVAILHLVRLVFRWTVTIGDFTVPIWWSAGLAAIAFALALWMFKSVR